MDEDATAADRAAPPPSRALPWFAILLGVALLAGGAGAWLLGKPTKAIPARVVGLNMPVNAGATSKQDISANNSPSLARNPVDPANLVVANRIDRPGYSCALHASFNGGAGWQDLEVPFPAGEEDPPRCYAPDVAYSPDGTLHMSFVTLKGVGNVPNAVWTVSSKDGGRTLTEPVKAAGPLAFQVRLTADPSRPDRLYLTWLQADGTGNLLFPNVGNPIVMSTSTDGGATWSATQRVTPPSRARAVAPSPAIGPKGELYVLYLDLLDDRLDYAGAHEGRGGDPYDGPWALVLARSSDQGTSWSETVVDGALVPTLRFIVFLPPTPALAVDPRSGRVYAAFTNGKLGDPDVNVWTSSNGGKSFGRGVRVNDTPLRDRTSQYLPRVDIAPGGRLDVLYFDRRADQANVENEVSLQSSFDEGSTFSRRVRVTDRQFDSRVGPGSDAKLTDLGSSLALVSTGRRALAVWPDTRAGTELTSKQDLASAVVDIPPPPATSRPWLRWVGVASMALGLLVVLLALANHLRSRPRRTAGPSEEAAPLASEVREEPVTASTLEDEEAEPAPLPPPPPLPPPSDPPSRPPDSGADSEVDLVVFTPGSTAPEPADVADPDPAVPSSPTLPDPVSEGSAPAAQPVEPVPAASPVVTAAADPVVDSAPSSDEETAPAPAAPQAITSIWGRRDRAEEVDQPGGRPSD